jgi:sporulation protein YlmC with PRC-barrel domain
MKKTLLKIVVICAASMLGASTWAQSEPQNNPPSSLPPNPANNRGWSTKSLSATGRADDGAVRVSKLVGAPVKDSSGHNAGQIQDIIVNPNSGRIDFALLSVGSGGTSSTSPAIHENDNGKLVPVPWALLRASASSQYSGGGEQLTFTLNADQSKLSGAPTVDWSDLSQSQWRQRIYAYYGVTPEPPDGVIKSQGPAKTQTAPEQPRQPNQ